MDLFKRWYPATVRYAIPKTDKREGAVRVAFDGWGPRFDEWIPLNSVRLAPAGTRVDFFARQPDDVVLDVPLPEFRVLPASRRAVMANGTPVSIGLSFCVLFRRWH